MPVDFSADATLERTRPGAAPRAMHDETWSLARALREFEAKPSAQRQQYSILVGRGFIDRMSAKRFCENRISHEPSSEAEDRRMYAGSRKSISLPASILSSILVVVTVSAAMAGQFEDGISAANRGDYATALTLWRPLAEQGDAVAQFNIGISYLNGYGVPKDVS
jgi:hypothetical protein